MMYHNAFLVVMSCLKDMRKNKTNHVKHSEHSKIAATKKMDSMEVADGCQFPILGEYVAYGPVIKTEYRISGRDANCGSGYCANKQSSKHCPSAGGEGESASYQSFYHSISGILTCSEECRHYCDMYAQQAREQNYSVPLASWQIASTNRFFGISYCRFDVSDIDIVGCALFLRLLPDLQ